MKTLSVFHFLTYLEIILLGKALRVQIFFFDFSTRIFEINSKQLISKLKKILIEKQILSFEP